MDMDTGHDETKLYFLFTSDVCMRKRQTDQQSRTFDRYWESDRERNL